MGCAESIESEAPNSNLKKTQMSTTVATVATKQKQQKPVVKPSKSSQDVDNPQDFFTSRNQDFNQGSPIRYFSRQEYMKNPKFSAKEDIDQQIVFLEPSPAQKKLKKLKKQGGSFTDDAFPPQLTSLIGVEEEEIPDEGDLQLFQIVQWARLTQLFQNPQIVKNRPNPHDIKQGQIGDCYFLAGLAALAQKPSRIMNLFLNRQITSQKNIAVKLLFKGKWMTIDLDDYIPTLNGEPVFSAAEDGSLWVTLLEKAWAKLYSNYNRIQYGDCQQAIHDLTGAPIRQVKLRGVNFNKEQEWKYLLQATQKQYAMVAGTPNSNDGVKNIAANHAYTLLKAVVISVNKKQERMVLLRDPYGDGNQFVGKWSDFSKAWDSVSEADKKRINYKPDEEDGLFWMSYDEFLKHFDQISIAQIEDKASYVYDSIKDQNSEGVYFILDIAKQGVYSLQIDRTPIRSYPKDQQGNFQFADIELMVGKIEDGFCNQWESIELDGDRTPYKKIEFTPGSYAAYVRMYFVEQFEKDFEVNLAVYSAKACKIRAATQDQVANLSQQQAQEGQQEEGYQQGQGQQEEEYQEEQQGQEPQEQQPQQGQEGEQENQEQQQPQQQQEPEQKPQKQKKAFTQISRKDKNTRNKNPMQVSFTQQITIPNQAFRQQKAHITREQFLQMFPQPYPPPRRQRPLNPQYQQQSQQFTQVYRHQYQPQNRAQYSFAPQYAPQYPRRHPPQQRP